MRNRCFAVAVITALSLATSVLPAAAAMMPITTKTTYTNANSIPADLLARINARLKAAGQAPLQSTPAPAPKPTPTPTPKPTPTPTPAPTPSSTNDAVLAAPLTAQESQLISLVNNERTSRGLKPLAADMRLVKAARMKSLDMIKNNYFGHQSPVYGSPFDLLKSQGITYNKAGENLAGTATVEHAHTILMNSTGHRANILNPAFTKIGVGVVKGGPYGYMFTQLFIG